MSSNTSVLMTRANLEAVPPVQRPDGIASRLYRLGDRRRWVDLHVVADRYNTVTTEVFDKQFHGDEDALSKRMQFLFERVGDDEGECLATATAWYDDENQRPDWGRVHWVAVHPDYQGKGLGKVLLSDTLLRLRELGHKKAFLDTSTGRLPAIGLYLRFGFTPHIRAVAEIEAWRDIIPVLKPDLAALVQQSLDRKSDSQPQM